MDRDGFLRIGSRGDDHSNFMRHREKSPAAHCSIATVPLPVVRKIATSPEYRPLWSVQHGPEDIEDSCFVTSRHRLYDRHSTGTDRFLNR